MALCAFLSMAVFGQISCSETNEETKSSSDTQFPGGKPVVFTVNYPLSYFAKRIGGELIEVHFPAPQDVDPAFWKPDAKMIGAYQKADLILINGAKYAKWIPNAALPDSKLVNTTRAKKVKYIKVASAIVHSHGPGSEHSHAGTAFTTWLDPMIAIEQARAIKDALLKTIPSKSTEIEANFAEIERDLLELDRQLVAIVKLDPKKLLLASHPVYQYLARRYGLNLKSVQWEPDVVPEKKSWESLAAILKDHPAKWMIWEADPIAESKKQLHDLGIETVVFAPAGNAPQSGDYLSVMRHNVENLSSIFVAEPEPTSESTKP